MHSEYGAFRGQEPIDRRIADLARSQHGVFTRAQALELGVTMGTMQRRIASTLWVPMHRGVFRLAGVPPTWRQLLIAACFALGPLAVVSHAAAAALWRLVGFERRPIELTVPRSCKRRGPGTVHRTVSLDAVDLTVVEGIPVTTVARTLIDIAGTQPPDLVEEALDDALRRKLVTVPKLRLRLRALARRGRPGIATMEALADARAGVTPPESPLETRAGRFLVRSGLAGSVPQYQVRDEAGRLVARVDYALPDERVAVEADSAAWHLGRREWERDLARRNELTALGWHVIHVTAAQLRTHPEKIARAVAHARASRGR